MPNDFSAYIAQDRREALARGRKLPGRASGAAMFADVTGFTPLAEALALAYGPRRGAEELTALLNQVYDALIAQVERFGGSVVGFSGDAITCWFDDDGRRPTDDRRPTMDVDHEHSSSVLRHSSASLRAATCALAMTAVMATFATRPALASSTGALAVKIAVATGAVRRFLIGDPEIQLLDVLAGAPLDRLGAIAHLAEHADVLADEPTAAALGAAAIVREWRADAQTGARAAVIAALRGSAEPVSSDRATVSDCAPLCEPEPRAWLPPPVYARLNGSAAAFVAELRPAVALMLQFGGFDYERDDGARLDAYIRRVQQIVTRYDGIVADVTMADKGGYLYATFGAPVAHEDDALRAAYAALELRAITVERTSILARIGIGQGTMRVGPYGSANRRAYGVLGDQVNLACRLMSYAAPGEVLASGAFQRTLADSAGWAALPPIQVKGKRAPVAVYQLLSAAPAAQSAPFEAAGTTAMIGRAAERATLAEFVHVLQRGTGRAVVIEGEPGIGKSRLIAETLRHANGHDPAVLVGCGQSIEQSSYWAWRDIFSAYFGFTPADSIPDRQARAQTQVGTVAPALLAHLPLLNDLLSLDFPSTKLTRALDAAQRSQHLDDLLIGLLRARALDRPLIVVLEDAHWLDARSWKLAIRVAHEQLPLLLVIAIRSLGATEPSMPWLLQLLQIPGSHRLMLSALPAEQTIAVAAARLGLAPAELPEQVAGLVRDRAGGNPFFAEELVAALRDEGQITVEAGAPGQRRCIASPDFEQAGTALPNTIQGMILSRIDRLPPAERLTLSIAAVIGPTFAYELLYPLRAQQAAIEPPALVQQLRTLAARDFIWLETPAPQLTYRFKHVLTQEAAYQSLLYIQRREIHRLVADWYEQSVGGQPRSDAGGRALNMAIGLAPHLSILAHHCRQAEDTGRERYYMALLGDQAISSGAFDQAIICFERSLALLPQQPATQARRGLLLGRLARAYALLGQSEAAERFYLESSTLAEAAADQVGAADAAYELGSLALRRAALAPARDYIARSLDLYRAAADQAGQARALNRLGAIYIEQNDEANALECYQQALALGRSGIERGARPGRIVSMPPMPS